MTNEAQDIIPTGMYCYEILNIEISKDRKKSPDIKAKNCGFYKRTQECLIGRCKLLKVEITDQCKECGINIDYEDE